MRPLETVRVHLCREAVDFRKAINGLSALVAEDLALDPFSAHVFGFCNRRRDQVKLLVWERNGFVLWQKRLASRRIASRGRVNLPRSRRHSVYAALLPDPESGEPFPFCGGAGAEPPLSLRLDA